MANIDKIKILVVEDSMTQAMQLQHILEKNGYDATVVSDGSEALRSISKSKPLIVISDIIMPEMDGYELCRQIKSNELYRDISVILLTVLSQPQAVILALRCGADKFLTKPYDENQLLSAIQQLKENLNSQDPPQKAITVSYRGETYSIDSTRSQIINLLLSTYETAVTKSLELIKTQAELKRLNEGREEIVDQRTAVIRFEANERKAAEEEVVQTAREWQTTLDAANDAIWILDKEQRILRSNKTAERFFHLPCGDLIDKYCWEIVHGTTQPIPECPFLRARKSLRRETMDLQIGEGWFQVTVDPILDVAGQYAGAVHIVSDITDRKRAEEQIHRQSKLLAAINSVFLETLTAESEEAVAQVCLNVAQELTGSKFGFIGEITPEGLYTTTALSDPGWEACRIPETKANVLIKDMVIRGIWGQVILKEQSLIVNDPVSYPNRVGIPEGHPPLTSFLGVPLKDQGKVIGMIAMANRVSGYTAAHQQDMEALSIAFVEAIRRKQAEKKISQLNIELEQRVLDRTAQLEATNKELETFSYSVSHDLRAPLRSIDGFSQILLEKYQDKPLDDKGKTYLEKVCKATQRMSLLIDDILKLSRITKVEFKRRNVNMSGMTRAIAEEYQKDNPDRVVDVIVQEGIMVQGDSYLMQIAMENLMNNAWKFTGKEAHPRIEFGTTVSYGKNACFIRDNGAGFDMAYANKLFGAFQRLHTTDEFPGTGIGLATVQRIIHRHGGQVWAEGEKGKGAVFYFTLP